ncbi:MAG TPA: helix-turn-helix transcriptional regulator [Planctomycetota bacterium]|nr:helix-turn-helix transcriptional regulator [Planctomycetota bacterium]
MHLATPPGTSEASIDPARCPPLRGDGLTWVGCTASVRGYEYRNQRQPGWQVVVVDGAADVWCDGGWRALPTDAVYVAPPGADVGTRLRGAARIWWTCAERRFAVGTTEPERVLAPELASLLRAAASAAIDETDRPEAAAAVPSWVALLADLATRAIARARGEAPPADPLAALWAAVRARPAARWTAADVRRASGLPRERLRRLCRARHGCSPQRRITAFRLEHAALLLRRSALPVAEIARRVGYARPFAFSTAFRRTYGASPRAWRASAG